MPRAASSSSGALVRLPVANPARSAALITHGAPGQTCRPLMSPRRSIRSADLERAWSHPAATAATRKRILRTAISEIIVRRDGATIHAVLHWQGGNHTELQVKQRLNAAGRHNP